MEFKLEFSALSLLTFVFSSSLSLLSLSNCSSNCVKYFFNALFCNSSLLFADICPQSLDFASWIARVFEFEFEFEFESGPETKKVGSG